MDPMVILYQSPIVYSTHSILSRHLAAMPCDFFSVPRSNENLAEAAAVWPKCLWLKQEVTSFLKSLGGLH
jgi:hypothetical protein